jgi:hypothetical protein
LAAIDASRCPRNLLLEPVGLPQTATRYKARQFNAIAEIHCPGCFSGAAAA